MSRKHFDLRVYICLTPEAERANKAAGRYLTWAEIEENTLAEMPPFDDGIFWEKTSYSHAVTNRVTTSPRPVVPQPMGHNVVQTKQPTPNPPRRDTERNIQTSQNDPDDTEAARESSVQSSKAPSCPTSPAFPPLEAPKNTASELFKTPPENSLKAPTDREDLVSPEPSLYSYDHEDGPAAESRPSTIPKLQKPAMTKERIGETKKNLFENTEIRRKTRAASSKSETATIDEEHAPTQSSLITKENNMPGKR